MPFEHRLIGILAVVIISLPPTGACRKSEDRSISTISAGDLPDFRAQDINGRKVNRALLRRKYSFIQFLGPDRRSDELLYSSIASEFNRRINIIIIGDNLASVAELSRGHSIVMIPDENGSLRDLFGVPKFGFFSVYDPHGRRVASGTSQATFSGSLRNNLRRLLNRIDFKTEMFIPPEGHILDEYDWFGPLALKIRANPRDYQLIVMFRTICEGCGSGAFVTQLKRIHTEGSGNIEVHLLVNTDFTEEDIINLSSQLRLDFTIEAADDRLAQKWEELVFSFGGDSINGIAFLVDRTTKILKILGEKDIPGDFLRNCLELANGDPDEKQD